jgi:hypothetical protein
VFINDIVQLKSNVGIPQTGINIAVSKNNLSVDLLFTILVLSLSWFFIGYWILKTGVNLYSAPNFFAPTPRNKICCSIPPTLGGLCKKSIFLIIALL